MILMMWWQKKIWWILPAAVAVVIGLFIWLHHPIIPTKIKKQVNFVIFYPHSSNFKVDKTSFKFDGSAKVLSLTATSPTNKLTITEQATPDPINDIPQYYSALVNRLNGYKDFDAIDGHVSLTRPTELKGAQSAVFNGKGTLMFVHPDKDLTDDDWRKFFNSLAIIK